MLRKIMLGAMLFVAVTMSSQQKDLRLWYTTPAKSWMTSALPIGNGRIGAMVFGGVEKEHIQFNDKTLWTGNKTVRGSYQNFGDIFIEFKDQTNVTDYVRDLNLNTALASVKYKADGVAYTREYLASHPDDAIAMHFSASKKSKISFSVQLQGAHNEKTVVNDNSLEISGKFELLSYNAKLIVLNDGGTISHDGVNVTVSNANSATIYLVAATDYDPTTSDYLTTQDWRTNLASTLSNVTQKQYSVIAKQHLADYQHLFNRVHLDINAATNTEPTNELLSKYRLGEYNAMAETLFFQYGRYLAIAASREGLDLPSNLQGLWNNTNTPPWESDIHSNINIQMNYWPMDVTNLAECNMPFIKYIYNEAIVHDSWKNMASELDCRGWVIKTQNNIFGYSDWNWNRPANAWYCFHIWDKYKFNPDAEYLRNIAYPVLKSACEFWFDRLIVGDDGKLLAPNEWSPEHGPWESGISYAQQLIKELFVYTIEASEILAFDDTFTKELKSKNERLDNGLAIGSWGQLREWKHYQDEKNDNHRHVSHLIGLHPGTAISPITTPEFAKAAETSLDARGDGGTGWSRVWKISFWARLLNGDRAHKLLAHSMDLIHGEELDMVNRGGVYENFFDAHPPFQIDGNYGATAAIAEMLIQSHQNEIHLLPALPAVWKQGEVKGLKARGAFEIEMKWASNKLATGSVLSLQGGKCVIRTSEPIKVAGTDFQCAADGEKYYTTTFYTKAGTAYKFVVAKK